MGGEMTAFGRKGGIAGETLWMDGFCAEFGILLSEQAKSA